jgi:hypothetical protein
MKKIAGIWFWWQQKWDFSVENDNDAYMGTNVGPIEGGCVYLVTLIHGFNYLGSLQHLPFHGKLTSVNLVF